MIAANASIVPTKFLCIGNGQIGVHRAEVADGELRAAPCTMVSTAITHRA